MCPPYILDPIGLKFKGPWGPEILAYIKRSHKMYSLHSPDCLGSLFLWVLLNQTSHRAHDLFSIDILLHYPPVNYIST